MDACTRLQGQIDEVSLLFRIIGLVILTKARWDSWL